MKKYFKVNILPEFQRLFLSSNHNSCMYIKYYCKLGEKGRSNFMIRPSRKRNYKGKTAEQMLEENKDYKKENDRLIETINNMKYDIEDYDRLKVEYD